MGIRAKLLTTVGAVVAASVAATAFLAHRLQSELIEHDLYHARAISQSQRLKAERFAALCRVMLRGKERLRLLGHLQGLMADSPELLYAYAADASGRIVVHSDSSFEGQTEARWQAARPNGAEETVVRLDPPEGPGGRAVLGFGADFHTSRPWEMEEARERLGRRMLGLGAAAVVLSLAAALTLAWRLTRPLAALAKAAQSVGQGRFDVNLGEEGADEIGALARRFEEMARGLAALEETKDAFIAAVNHDLRGPLSAISMSAAYLMEEGEERESLSDGQRRLIGNILDSARRLEVFVTNVLDAGKIKAGRMEYAMAPVPLEPLAHDLELLFGVAARRRGIALAFEVAAGTPPAWADGERLAQALSNLIVNALKFTPSGGRLELRARAEGAGALIEVSDTGRGISPEDLPHVFERYRQFGVARQKSDMERGTGLGLSLVKQTVEALGGTVSVASELGKGTRFTIRLRAAPAGALSADDAPPGSPPSEPGGAAGPGTVA